MSPFPPLHVARGYSREDSVVTVIGAEAPHSVIYSGDRDDPQDSDRLLAQLAVGLSNLATNNGFLRGGGATVILNPEHALILADAGMSREHMTKRLHELCTHA